MKTAQQISARGEKRVSRECLSETEMANIFGAGRRPFVSLGIEMLETRDLMAVSLAGAMPTVLPATGNDNATGIVAQSSNSALAAPAAVQSTVQNLLDTKVVAFDVTTKGSLSFNLDTGAYAAKIELPAGVTLDTSALKALMNGQFALPKVEPVQALSALGGLKTSVSSDYDQVQAKLFQQYGGGNVYLSTERFTDWASPENVAGTLGSGILTGGANAGQALQEARDVVLGELGNIYTWLKHKAPQEAEATVAAALKGILTGQDVDTPYLALKFVDVNQSYTIGLGGAAATIADGLGAGSTSRTVTATHKGFALIWKGPGDSLDSLTNSLNSFDGASLEGKADFTSMIGRLANRPELKGLGQLAEAVLSANPSALADQLVTTKLSSALGVTRSQLSQLYQPGNPIIDLKSTPLGAQLGKLLGNLAAGNEGSAQVTKLQFNLNTYEVTAEVTVRHRHSWGSVNDILKAVGKQIGEWVDKAGDAVSQKLDAAGNTVREVANKAADKVTEVFDKAGALIHKTIVNSAGVKVLEAAWQDGRATLETVRDAAGKLVSEYWRDGSKEFQNLYTNGVRTAYSVWVNSVNTVHTTWNTARQKLTDYWVDGSKKISQWFTNGKVSAENIVQNGVTISEKAWKDGVTTLNRVRDAAGNLVSEYWRDGSKEFQNLYTGGVRTAYSVWANGVNTVHTTWNTARQKLTDYWVDGSKKISQWFTNGKVSAENIVQKSNCQLLWMTDRIRRRQFVPPHRQTAPRRLTWAATLIRSTTATSSRRIPST
jgi:hypothetical protein